VRVKRTFSDWCFSRVRATRAMLGLAILVALISFCFALYLRPASRNKNVPPGPKGQFLLGNTKQLPREKPWIWWTELSKQYGNHFPPTSCRLFFVAFSGSRHPSDFRRHHTPDFSRTRIHNPAHSPGRSRPPHETLIDIFGSPKNGYDKRYVSAHDQCFCAISLKI